MRTDARFSRRQVICPKVRLIGYNTVTAKPGYWIGFSVNGTASGYQCGRVIGCVDAPAIGDDKEPIKGWIVALVLSQDMHACYERWVRPEWVQDCQERRPHALLSWLTGNDVPTDPVAVLKLYEQGYLSERYIGDLTCKS